MISMKKNKCLLNMSSQNTIKYMEIYSSVEQNLFVKLLIKKDEELRDRACDYAKKIQWLIEDQYIQNEKEFFVNYQQIVEKYKELSYEEKKEYMELKFDQIEWINKDSGKLIKYINDNSGYWTNIDSQEFMKNFIYRNYYDKKHLDRIKENLENIKQYLLTFEEEKNEELTPKSEIIKKRLKIYYSHTKIDYDWPLYMVSPIVRLDKNWWKLDVFEIKEFEKYQNELQNGTSSYYFMGMNDFLLLDKEWFENQDLKEFILNYSLSKMDLTCDARLIEKKWFE